MAQRRLEDNVHTVLASRADTEVLPKDEQLEPLVPGGVGTGCSHPE
eukprot:CAMPEP_0204194816 /NCGR_PEP_ID=MMETSP0361-20130328/62638_1 /ASSEMBLY_ACC=CAM_ASM_000343 /TAXON_ID=268821 /ORGANISM="Scrippsiella Hangoei, Strain SHTV-5" /LENGTH=45 /DNA_ID= /DNA_START= /DNA_END= /DNA_ORIENTATION=